MVTAGTVLKRLSREIGLESAFKLAELQAKWQDIFDERLRGHMYPHELRGDVLIIHVDSPLWLQELSYLKKEILKRLEGFSIKDLTLKIGKVPRCTRSQPKAALASDVLVESLKETPSWALDDLEQVLDHELREHLEGIIKMVTAKSQEV